MREPCQGSEVNDCDQAACKAETPHPLTTWQPCLEFHSFILRLLRMECVVTIVSVSQMRKPGPVEGKHEALEPLTDLHLDTSFWQVS